MAPEYVVHGHLTEKADVYSFGVLVVEIVTGKRCGGSTGSHSGHSLLAEVWHNYKANSLQKVIDEGMYEQSAGEEIMRVVQVGLLCTQANPGERPAMSKVVELLRNRGLTRDDHAGLVLSEPPFFEVDAVVDVGGGGEASKLLSCNSACEVSGSYSQFSGR